MIYSRKITMHAPIALPTTDLNNFRLAYRAWRTAIDEYDSRLQQICDGREIAGVNLQRFVRDIQIKHARFVECSQQICRSK
jgi:hypothetical protein